jgi:hypothetical protein
MKVIGFASAILAFALCTAAGMWMLFSNGSPLDMNVHRNDPLRLGLALYFMGKGVFVGCMLMMTTVQLGSTSKNRIADQSSARE